MRFSLPLFPPFAMQNTTTEKLTQRHKVFIILEIRRYLENSIPWPHWRVSSPCDLLEPEGGREGISEPHDCRSRRSGSPAGELALRNQDKRNRRQERTEENDVYSIVMMKTRDLRTNVTAKVQFICNCTPSPLSRVHTRTNAQDGERRTQGWRLEAKAEIPCWRQRRWRRKRRKMRWQRGTRHRRTTR